MQEPSTTRRRKALLRYTALLLALWAVFVLAQTLTACIPQSAVASRVAQAAADYKTADMFALLDPNDNASVVHHYADALLVNILWSQDSAHPLTAAMDGRFYQSETDTQGQNLAIAVDGANANTSYARYWHGMLIFLKPLLCVISLSGAKLLGAVVLALLAAVYFALLVRRRLYAAAVSSAVGCVLVQIWIVPMCIEYYACFALMFVFADVILLRGDKLQAEIPLFLCAGALTCFFDFLTCEILTLCIPLACLLLVRRQQAKPAFFTAVRACGAWLTAYAATWACKWLLSAAILGRSVTDIALGQGAYRAVGVAEAGVDIGFQPLAAICVNLSCIFPFKLLEKAPQIWLAFAGMCLALFCLWFLYRKTPGQSGCAPVLAALALVPFVRYFLINNHAALHPFFTYRDLLISIVCLSCAMALSISFGQTKKPVKPKKGGKR